MENCKKVIARFKGNSYDVNVSSYDAVNDLAIGKINKSVNDYLPLSSDVYLAEEILVSGFPLTDLLGNSIKATKGIVSSLSGPDNNSF